MSRVLDHPRGSRIGDRRGGALVLVVLSCLILTLVAHALLLLSRTEAVITRHEGRRLEAEFGARAELVRWAAVLDSLPQPGVQGGPPAAWLEVRRPSAELAILEAVPTGSVSAASGRSSLILYAPDPVSRVSQRVSGLRTPTLINAPGSALTVEPDPCPEALGLSPLIGASSLPDSVPGGVPAPGIGGLDVAALSERLPGIAPGIHSVSPLLDPGGNCLPSSDNWGDPARPGGPCWGRWAVFAGGGDLTLAKDSRFRGWLVVSGTLHMEEGAIFTGVADAGVSTVLDAGTEVRVSRCAALESLANAVALRRPARIGPAGWPVYPF